MALLLAAALASEPVDVVDVPEMGWSVPVRSPEIPLIWVPVAATDSVRPATEGDAGALPAAAGGRELPSPWARRGRHMTENGQITASTPTRVHPETGETLVRQRPSLGVRITLVSLGGVVLYAGAAAIVAGAASPL